MFNHELILNHIDDIFGQDMHAKRVLSLANATLGVIESGSLAIHAIGSGLSLANGLERKHAVKQVDRLLTQGEIVNILLKIKNSFLPTKQILIGL